MDDCNELQLWLQEISNGMEKDQDEAEQLLPKVLEAKKIQFLKAIGKSEFIVENANEGAKHDEKYVLENLFMEPFMTWITGTADTLIFDDGIVITEFKKLKKPVFDLKKYIASVKCIYSNYLEYQTDMPVIDFSLHNTFAYVLAFARDFNDASKDMFDFFDDGIVELSCVDQTLPKEFPGNKLYIKRLNKLISDLLESYSERKYQQLNLNVTYLILLMLRRFVKTEKEFADALTRDKTHIDYAELCPYPLDYRLPMITEGNNLFLDTKLRRRDDEVILLILYAYMKNNGRTRRVLRATCLQHMEYNGLGLLALFSKVAKLYNVKESHLWDLLSCKDSALGLLSLSDCYHSQSEGARENPPKSYTLFPYCRVFNSYYHDDLSASHPKNFLLCYTLAYLVDLKLGLDVSSARLAQWTQGRFSHLRSKGEQMALKAYELLKG